MRAASRCFSMSSTITSDPRVIISRRSRPDFFTDRHQTPWGAAIDFAGPDSRPVRDFFINNALYWLDEFHFDGLRFDAVHAIFDESEPDIISEIGADESGAASPIARSISSSRTTAIRPRYLSAPAVVPAVTTLNGTTICITRCMSRDRRHIGLLRRLCGRAGRHLGRAWPRGWPIRASRRRFAAASRAASLGASCRRPPLSHFSRTTTRSATILSEPAFQRAAERAGIARGHSHRAAVAADPAVVHGRGMGEQRVRSYFFAISSRACAMPCARGAAANSPFSRISGRGGARADPRPDRFVDLRDVSARLGGAAQQAAFRLARALPPIA